MKRNHVLFLVCLMTLAAVLVIGPTSAQAKRGWWGIMSDADGSWTSVAATVSFSTYGLAPTGALQYSTDDGASWTQGTSLVVPAPTDHSNDGVHDVYYRFVDSSGATLRSGFCQVKIDTTLPDTFSPNASCVTGETCRFRFLIVDCIYLSESQILPLSPTAQATLVIWKWVRVKGKWVQDVHRTIDLGRQQTNVFPEESWVSYDWQCDLPPDDYWYAIEAVDEAGNPYNHADHSQLAVGAAQ